ncbi:hypothetical protein A2U01_0083834, partial [Trifolium medium]|nr:hypothetical protein [Trifolium medium]
LLFPLFEFQNEVEPLPPLIGVVCVFTTPCTSPVVAERSWVLLEMVSSSRKLRFGYEQLAQRAKILA